MNNPIYQFILTAGGTSRTVYPVWSDGLSKSWERESGEMFFRQKMSGQITFRGADADYIVSRPFDTRFGVGVNISYDNGASWEAYWQGAFWKTDCKFDEGTVAVTPEAVDNYTALLEGMEKEFDLISLAPAMRQFNYDKRAMVQIYVAGQSVIGCFLSNMYWEEECTAVTSDNALRNTYRFGMPQKERVIEITGNITPDATGYYYGEGPTALNNGYAYSNGTYTFRYTYTAIGGGATQTWAIVRESDGAALWSYTYTSSNPQDFTNITLSPAAGTGTARASISDLSVYGRIVCDVQSISGNPTSPIPSNDLVGDNRNYGRVIGLSLTGQVWFYDGLTDEPTEYGLYQPGQYYRQLHVTGMDFFPVSRNGWGRLSVWFNPAPWLEQTEAASRAVRTFKDAYTLASVIAVLLKEIAPGLKHEETEEYSRTLYGLNPVTGVWQSVLLTPKSNLVASSYDQPAQRAPITLKEVLDMLRDCFRVYWFVDDSGRFRLEHVQFFRNGGSWGIPAVGVDLTANHVQKSGKAWDFGQGGYSYEKPEMTARYEFGWMDDGTLPFDGLPIDIESGYVQKDKIERIDVSRFTSDVDYMLLNPSDISKEGFALFAATQERALVNETAGGGQSFAFDITQYAGKRVTAFMRSTEPTEVVIATPNAYTPIGVVEDNTLRAFSFDVPADAEYLYNIPGGGEVTIVWVYGGDFYLPYSRFDLPGVLGDALVQNGYVSFAFLQDYYAFDMPAWSYRIGDKSFDAAGVKKLKVQEVIFPAYRDPDILKLVKTSLGNGVFGKLLLNLSSRRADATLNYEFDVAE